MKQPHLKVIIIFLLIVVWWLLFFIVKRGLYSGEEQVQMPIGRDLTIWNTVFSGSNVVLPNNWPYAIIVDAKEFQSKQIRIDVVTWSLNIDATIVNGWVAKKINSWEGRIISTLTQQNSRPDGTRYDQHRKTCVVIWTTSDECEYIIQGINMIIEEWDEKVIITLNSSQMYGNPVFNWSIK